MLSSQNDIEAHCNVAIIGGGFTGAVLAYQLLRLDSSLSVALIESSGRPGRGVAYSTSCSWHLLNVQAGNMSALHDDPEHFVRWARANHNSETHADDFLPRRVYGQYIESLLLDAKRRYPEQLRIKRDEVRAIEARNGFVELEFSNGKCISADRAVLALGNFQPGAAPWRGMKAETRRYVDCAWKVTAVDFEELAQEESILLVGSGLTAVDVAIALRSQDFAGTLHIVSRHGLVPRGHEYGTPECESWSQGLPISIRTLLNSVRKEIKRVEREGGDWRSVIDSLRPVTAQIWQSLPLDEKRRFLRHVRAYWDVHRHRIAPEVCAQIRSGLEDGGIQLHAGRITEYREEEDAATVTYRERKSGELKPIRVGRVINCTTPETDCRKVASPLLQKLLGTGLARPDPLFLGLDTAEDGALISAHGEKSELLYTLGPALKGKLWESIAVPEIRVQIAKLAATITDRPANESVPLQEKWTDVDYSETEQLNF